MTRTHTEEKHSQKIKKSKQEIKNRNEVGDACQASRLYSGIHFGKETSLLERASMF